VLLFCIWQVSFHFELEPSTRLVIELPETNSEEGKAILKAADAEWRPILLHGPIRSCRVFAPGDAFSLKYQIFFESGHVAMAKPMQRVIPQKNELEAYNRDIHRTTRRAQRGYYQGWPELIAYHLDRILGMERKPPTVTRKLSSRMVYYPKLDFGSSTKLLRSILNIAMLLVPEHNVDLTLSAWMDGLRATPPSDDVKRMLTQPMSVDREQAEYLRDVSNTLVFDFLVDDPDKKEQKNWVSGGATLMLWDNGLGWSHGPYGRSSCLDILCGHRGWRAAEEAQSRPCQRVCVFSTSLISQLMTYKKAHENPLRFASEKTLGETLKESMKSEVSGDVFRFNSCYRNETDPSFITFPVDEFYNGMDAKVQLLMKHVDACIEKHGIRSVLGQLP